MAGKKTSNRTSTKKVNTKSKNYGLTQNRGKGGKSGRNDTYIENRKKLKDIFSYFSQLEFYGKPR